MINNDAQLIAEISDLLASGRVVPVVGSGVPTAATGIPGWRGIIESGLEHVASVGTCDEHELKDARSLLRRPDLVTAAQRMAELLGAPGGEFPFWLNSVFRVDQQDVRSRQLVDRIVDLPSPIIATTNFDKLMSILHPKSPSIVTWRQPSAMRRALREGNWVIHLHGVYDDPKSVILGISDYRELTRHEGYRAVLQSLWLERTLLFIGCSFDGLQDPDFSRLLTWASDTFAGSHYKHYALLRNGTYTTEDAARFLHDWRIQVVGYGPSFKDLPSWLEKVNPYRERARAIRVARAKELLDTGDPQDRDALTAILESLARSDAPPDIDVAREAQRLFEKRRLTAEQLRGDLSALQQLTRTLVNPDAIDREISHWEQNRRSLWKPPQAFYATVLAAAEALLLFPESLLAALKRRRIDIHQRVLDGYCGQLIDDLKHDRFLIGEYSIENLKRVLTTLKAILEIDPSTTFPDPKLGQILRIDGKTLVVIREDRIELREWEHPVEIVASLPIGPPPAHHAEIVRFRGDSALMVYNNELVMACDPRRSAIPIAEYQVSEAFGINSAAHLQIPSGLRSVLSTTAGTIHELLDLKSVRKTRIRTASSDSQPFVGDIALLPDGRLYGLYWTDEVLVEIHDDGQVSPLFNAESLREFLAILPTVKLAPNPRIGHWNLRSQEFEGRAALALMSTVRTRQHHDTTVILLHPKRDTAEIYSHYYLEDRDIIDFTIVLGEDKVPRLIGVLLSNFQQTYDLVVWSRATTTTVGEIFVTEGTLGRTYDDMTCVTAIDLGNGFAGDDSGGLFAFSIQDSSFREIDRDKNSRIRSLLVTHW